MTIHVCVSVCVVGCVFVSYISSMTVQKHDTPMALWHLASSRREGVMYGYVCACARAQ